MHLCPHIASPPVTRLPATQVPHTKSDTAVRPLLLVSAHRLQRSFMLNHLFTFPSFIVFLISAFLLTYSQFCCCPTFCDANTTNKVKHGSQSAFLDLFPSITAIIHAYSGFSLHNLHHALYFSSHTVLQPTRYPPAHEASTTKKIRHVNHSASHLLLPSPTKRLYAYSHFSFPLSIAPNTFPNRTHLQLTFYPAAFDACTTKKIKHINHSASSDLSPLPISNSRIIQLTSHPTAHGASTTKRTKQVSQSAHLELQITNSTFQNTHLS